MKQHPLSSEEVQNALFVRPASALGHMRQQSGDSLSVASVVGLSINVVELPPGMQVRMAPLYIHIQIAVSSHVDTTLHFSLTFALFSFVG